MNRHSTHARGSEATVTTRQLLIGLIAAALVAVVVIAYGLVIAKGVAYTAAETRFLASVASVRSGPLVDVSLAMNWLFSPPIALIIGIIAAVVVLVLTRRWTDTIHFVLLVVVTWLSSEVVKLIVHRPRPNGTVADTLVPNPDVDSYPSGHVCFAVGLGFAVLILVANSRLRTLVAILAVLLALVTAATRVYLGIHFLTDSVASLVFAAAAFVAMEALWRRFAARVFRART